MHCALLFELQVTGKKHLSSYKRGYMILLPDQRFALTTIVNADISRHMDKESNC